MSRGFIMERLKDKYKNKVIPQLKKEFGYRNDLAVPSLEKVMVNIGLGKAISNPKIFETVENDLKLITGQKPIRTKARKSIAGFKLRKGMDIGMMVTLRGKRMYDFLDKLINVVLPRIKDFRGIKNNAFDGQGNYSLGITEHIVFPEINYEEVNEIYSLGINIITTAKNDQEGKRLLELLGFPFAK